MFPRSLFLPLGISATMLAQTQGPSGPATPDAIIRPGQAWTDPATRIELRWVPEGSFTMGSPEDESGRFYYESPQREVRISRGFWMGTFEVSQEQYQTTMGVNPALVSDVSPKAPVTQVSWDDACAFVGALNAKGGRVVYSLPTEAQWEYACRAGTTGATYGESSAIAWYSFNSGGRAHAVGEKQANAWGLHDMLGNVWEWCQDWYGDYPSVPEVDPTGPGNGSSRVLRGGSWLHTGSDSRAAARRGGVPSVRSVYYGFRVVATPRAPRS